MPDASDLLSCMDFSASSDLCVALDLSVTSEKRSVINLQCKSFAVKCIGSPRDCPIGNGVD